MRERDREAPHPPPVAPRSQESLSIFARLQCVCVGGCGTPTLAAALVWSGWERVAFFPEARCQEALDLAALSDFALAYLQLGRAILTDDEVCLTDILTNLKERLAEKDQRLLYRLNTRPPMILMDPQFYAVSRADYDQIAADVQLRSYQSDRDARSDVAGILDQLTFCDAISESKALDGML